MSSPNRLLSALPRDVQARVLAQAQRVSLQKRTILNEAGDTFHYAYFPLNGMVSLLSMTEDGDTVEVATIGNDGMIGLPILLPSAQAPYRVSVQLPTEVLRLRAENLRQEISGGPALHRVLTDYMQRLLGHMAQTAVCYRFHTVRQRVCRWLLTARDRADGNTLALTQESIAQTLGVPRTGVTAVAVELQDAGALRCRHGLITVLNRGPLEGGSCECYRVLRDDAEAHVWSVG